mmetsp:Transcript_24493/g.27850  ORF Transcript_24493/g.27850 Transcript_24493/m.27850 type:complete len:102 (+) Transcript_24493:476-781(+)
MGLQEKSRMVLQSMELLEPPPVEGVQKAERAGCEKTSTVTEDLHIIPAAAQIMGNLMCNNEKIGNCGGYLCKTEVIMHYICLQIPMAQHMCCCGFLNLLAC